MGGTHACALLGADSSHGYPSPPQDARANHGVNRPAADTSGWVGAMRGPTLRRGHPAWMRLTIAEPSRGALTGRRSELNRTGRRCPPPDSKTGAPSIKLTNQLLLQVCSGFPSLIYPPNTFGPGTRARRVRVHADPNAGRFWCALAKGCASPISTSPCGPRRGGLRRAGPRRRRPRDPPAAAGPHRPRRRRPPADLTPSPPSTLRGGMAFPVPPPPPGPAPPPPVPNTSCGDSGQCSPGGSLDTSRRLC